MPASRPGRFGPHSTRQLPTHLECWGQFVLNHLRGDNARNSIGRALTRSLLLRLRVARPALQLALLAPRVGPGLVFLDPRLGLELAVLQLRT